MQLQGLPSQSKKSFETRKKMVYLVRRQIVICFSDVSVVGRCRRSGRRVHGSKLHRQKVLRRGLPLLLALLGGLSPENKFKIKSFLFRLIDNKNINQRMMSKKYVNLIEVFQKVLNIKIVFCYLFDNNYFILKTNHI